MGGDNGTTTAGDALMLAYAIPTKFESPDATTVVEFDPDQGIIPDEWERRQELQGGIETIHGADYGYDPWGGGAAPVGPSQERIRALVENERVDTVLNTLHRIGRGRLWMQLHNDDERWAWAKIDTIPRMTLGAEDFLEVPFSIPFTRLSDWYAAEATVIDETITSSPETVNAMNDGMNTTRNIVITLTANSAGGFSNPSVNNTTTNETFTVNRAGGNGDMLRVDVLNFRAEYSEDGGTTWDDTTQSMFLANSQVSALSLLPDDNVIVVSGVTDATYRMDFYSAWR